MPGSCPKFVKYLYTPKKPLLVIEPYSATVFGNHTRLRRAKSMYDNNNPINGQFSSTPKYLSNKHLAEWCEGSAVNEAIARLNIESLTDKEFNERIRPKELIKTGGWWCRGVNWRTGVFMGTWYGQGKPDKAHHPEGSKERKYLTGSGMEPDAIFLAMPDKGYWAKVHADLSIPRHWTEGVKKAGVGLSLGLAVLALTGVWNWGKDGKLAKFVEEWAQPGTTHYIDFDSDYAAKPSCRAAIIKFAQLLIERSCTVYITCWDAKFKGLDDFIVGKGGDAFLQAVADASAFTAWEKQLKKNERKTNASKTNNSITPPVRTQENVVCLSCLSSNNDYIPDTAPIAGQNFILKAEDALYSDGHYVSIGGLLYRFTGSYYEELNESSEKRRIGGWLKTYSEKVKGVWVKNRADTASVNAVFSWVVNQTAVDPLQVNPGGLNCSNGVVKIHSDGSHELVAHDPKNIYTYVGCKYDPHINVTDCDRLLECLEPSQREIFLRTAAAALNLKLVRSKLTGRGVKGLLCHGEGSNGKDTLRAVLAAVYGNGMTGRSLSDFKSYDMGRKFALAGIEGSICNWASENTAKVDLDNIQSLKQFITGDPIDIERKGKDSYEYRSAAIFLANCNKLPSITGGTSAIDDRYGILRFDKTYVRNAIAAEGQLEADPRFKDDEKFILEQVAPAMLNKLLERLPLLLTEGIDYKATKDAMREAQEESRHLWQFVRDLGYEAGKGERVYAKDLWSELQEWYQEVGILELEYNEKGKEKLLWNDLPNQWDKPVKAINQLYARFSEIFPKLEKHRHTERGFESQRTMGDFYYLGIRKQKSEEIGNIAPASPAVDTARISSPAVLQQKMPAGTPLEQTILIQSAAGDAGALNPTILDLCNTIAKLALSDKQKLVELLTGVPCSDPLKAFRVGDKVAGNNPEDASYNWHGRIVEIHTSINCKVDWQEREGMKGGRVISMLFCNLRKI
jgi:putative DNA primase/helicase